MAELTPLYMDISQAYSGDELGLPWRDIIGEGVVDVDGGDLLVTEKSGTPDLSVDIAAGALWVLGDTNTDAQPVYRCRNDATVNRGISPDPSNPRKVIIIAQIIDETFVGVGRQWEIQAIHGTAAASPSEPALPDSAYKLAVIDVDTAATEILDADITDARTAATIGEGQASLPATPEWADYTPTLTAATTDPTLGTAAEQEGRYVQEGKAVHGHFGLKFGTAGVAVGSGVYRVSLPVTGASVAAGTIIGSGWVYDSSANVYRLVVLEKGSGSWAELRYDPQAAAGAAQVTHSLPFTPAANDQIRGTFTYEAA